ncbi:Nramp family divalent metal transporter [Nonomuraea sp. NEAU-A123]|uniref:Nramp family divalent metal transporter n=1 Tax=Nonomuraea sp. NEAU-A123 TaxID=2839649 RepID=UPI001BE4A552|nr:Nramp family divalent metal transporter [Nonomuraea sp. NEAU-A123]MBT2229973.1 Nramp family divalent metal transporter [Nonomuraea sp. NEAU-A123]
MSHPLGVSRPDLTVTDLPTPEEVFKVSKIGPKELVKYAIGPSLIALGISIGSGEWLLGPLNVGQYGFVGVGWVILVSALLQTFYNVECSRYVVATGETPVVGWGRVPPGWKLWVPLSVLVVIFAFIAGGWAASAGQGVYALVHGTVAPADAEEPRLWAIALLVLVFLITALAKRISRVLELANWMMVSAILLALLAVDLLIVPWSQWWEGIRGFVTPAAPPAGITATQLGGLAGFTALASGLNWYVMGHYRDKGYGMGYRAGFLSGMRGERSEILASGVTFPDDDRNRGLWRRWYRLLLTDMWGVFFVGAILGMLLPTLLMSQAVTMSGQKPTRANVPTFVAGVLGDEYGPALFYVALVLGVLILFSTQLGIFEAMVRVTTDAAHATSPRLRGLIEGDPRRFYYPFMIVLLVIISVIIHLSLPVGLVEWSANMSNLGALIYPFLLIYLNSRLPRPARPRPWHYVILILNFLFFGFFFINFIADFVGDPLVTF